MESFTKKHILGKGSSSIVYLVQRKIDQQLYALKQVHTQFIQINMAALD
jgi:serine/threonine protein kinase